MSKSNGVLWLKVFHAFVMFVTIAIILLAWFSIYMHVRYPAALEQDLMPDLDVGGEAPVKPLPDFMIENVGSDELEYLKP